MFSMLLHLKSYQHYYECERIHLLLNSDIWDTGESRGRYVPWATLIPQFESIAEDIPSSSSSSSSAVVLVPTMDTVRTEYLMDVLGRRAGKPVMLVGGPGSAKSLVVQHYLSTISKTSDSHELSRTIAFSSATTSTALQVTV